MRARVERKLHEAYARYNGYFWLPCPVCGEWFGGHEKGGGNARHIEPVEDEPYRAHSTCPNCPGYWEIRATRVPSDIWDFSPSPTDPREDTG